MSEDEDYDYLEKTKRLIRDLYYASDDALSTVRDIEGIANDLESTMDLAKAKLRLLIRRTPPPAESLLMDNSLCKALGELQKFNPDIRGSTIKYTKKLIRSALAIYPQAGAGFDVSRNGIEVCWRSNTPLTWLIRDSDISWPGVNVTAFFKESDTATTIKHRVFFSAHTLLDHFKDNHKMG